MKSDDALGVLAAKISACRICRDAPSGVQLPHEPRPVFRISATARLLVASQAPGIRVHESGIPFNDASGGRLRHWMNIGRDEFYDSSRIAIIPMGFCFPGWDASKGDLPPRVECRLRWHGELFAALPQVETILAIGAYAQAYHMRRLGLPGVKGEGLTGLIRRWRDFSNTRPRFIPLPHPSWRNSGWLRKNPWFEAEVLPELRAGVQRALRPHKS